MDNRFLRRILSRRWAPILGLLVLSSVSTIKLAVAEHPDCTAERAVEEVAAWLVDALRRPVHAPIHGL